MAETVEEMAKRNVSFDEVEMVVSIPAIYVNKTVLTVNGPVAKVAFFETREVEHEGATQLLAYPRTSVLMSLNDLISLRNLISSIEDQFETITVRPGGEDAAKK